MFFLALGLPVLAGFFILNCLNSYRNLFALFSMKISFAVGLGLGIASYFYLLCLIIFHSYNLTSIGAEILVLILIICFSFYLTIRNSTKNKFFEEIYLYPVKVKQKRNPYLLVSFWCVLGIYAVSFIVKSLNLPHGSWDAWAIWNMRARFLYRGGVHWAQAFSEKYLWSHPDYPVLVPGNVARIWDYLGSEPTIVPIVVGFIIIFATIGLVVGSVSYVRGSNQGLLAGLTLMGVTCFMGIGASQCADTPLAFYILATVVLFFLHERLSEKGNPCILLAGVMAGFSAWTKNEGLLFIMAVIIGHFIVVFPKKGGRAYVKELCSFLTGLVPILLLIVYFKIQLAPPNDLVSGQGMKMTAHRVTDFSRYLIVGKSFVTTTIEIVKASLIIFPACLILMGLSRGKQDDRSSGFPIIVLILMIIGYFLVYVISPQDLVWHLDTSLYRLISQLLPSAIFVFFILLRTPEEVQIKNNA